MMPIWKSAAADHIRGRESRMFSSSAGLPAEGRVSEMFFETVFVALALMLIGVAFCAVGFRLFVLLLPVFGFFAGFIVTAQSIRQLFGEGFLAATSSWVFGFFAGLLFAVLAYFFYYAAIAILAGTVGFEIGAGVIAGLGITMGFLHFIVGMVLALAFIAAVIFFNLPRLFIIVLTALAGSSMIVSGVLVALGRIPLAALQFGVVGDFLRLSWFWAIVYLAIAAASIVLQLLTPTAYSFEPYDIEPMYQGAPGPGRPLPVTPPSSAGPEGVPAT